VTFDPNSARTRPGDEVRLESDGSGLSRRELRLRAEADKVASIARDRERERIREAALKRAAEIRREKEAAEARGADEERFQEQVNNSQQLPTLTNDAQLFPPVVQAPVVEPDVSASPDTAVPSSPEVEDYASRGHEGARRRKRTESRAHKKESSRRGKKSSTKSTPHPHPIRRGAGRAFVLLIVSGLMAVLALPATGFNAGNTGLAAEKDNTDQSVKVTATGSEAEQIALGEYVVTSYADLLKLTYGVSSGFRYSVTNTGKVRWPFPVVVPISSGFGGRVAPCFGCSSYHQGLDFNPTEGTPFYAVAAGEVTQVHDDAWGLGKWVVISHTVGDYSFESLYAHMIRDSTGVRVGQQVQAGDYIGRVGNSGTSTGAHLHFEILVDGTPVDPFDWLKRHTKGN